MKPARKSLLADAAARRLEITTARTPAFVDTGFPAQAAFIQDPAKLKE